MKRGVALTFLIAILALGAFFRLDQINDQSLWLDEGVTYYNSSPDSYAGVWERTAELDQSPPGYYFIMHTYLQVFGENEFGFRLIPVVFGLLSILFLYLLMAEMISREAGVFAAFLLAITPFHIGFSLESRMYVLLSLESLMAFYFLYRALYSEGRGFLWWIFFILASVIGLYTHNFFVFILAGLALSFVILLPDVDKRLDKFLLGVLSALLILMGYLPWIPNFISQLEVERYWMPMNSLLDVKDYMLDFVNQSYPLLFGLMVVWLLGLVWVVFRIKSLDYRKTLLATLALFVFGLVSLGLPLGYSILIEPILKIRYVVYILPILLGGVAIGLHALRRITMIFPVIALIVTTMLLMPWKASAYPVEFGEDFRRLVEIIEENPADVVVHTPSIAHVMNFYNNGKFKIYPFPFSDDLRDYNFDESAKFKFFDLIARFDSFYLVVSHSHENPPGLLFGWAKERCQANVRVGEMAYFFTQCN